MDEIVSTEWLAGKVDGPALAIADVRAKPGTPGAGRKAFHEAHIPGAIFLDLDVELSDRSDLSRGRHPLPDPKRFVADLAAAGIGRDTTVVAYDDMSGGIAGRLWWLLRWIGHEDVAILDGGIDKWLAEDRPVESGHPVVREPHPDPISPQPNDAMVLATKEDVIAALGDGWILLDARSAERYCGESESLDKQAGHIKGATNAPFADNLQGDLIKTFRPPEQLREHFNGLGLTPEGSTACSCGSGVTACHDIIAIVRAGFPMPRLYPGSWSEWSLDPAMPTATGPQP